jgi:hypothetical protein
MGNPTSGTKWPTLNNRENRSSVIIAPVLTVGSTGPVGSPRLQHKGYPFTRRKKTVAVLKNMGLFDIIARIFNPKY